MTAASHILGDEWLVDYATGTAPGPVAAFVAAHLAVSDAARKAYACLEPLGGALLDAIAPVSLRPDALAAVLGKLDADATPARPASMDAPDGAILPAPLRPFAPGGLAALKWRTLARGFQATRLPCADARGYRMSLLRLEPGCAVPRHTHRGSELVMVLDGGYHDEQGHFVRGDAEVADPSIEHQPIADPGRTCVALIVSQGPPLVTEFPRRLMNPFLR